MRPESKVGIFVVGFAIILGLMTLWIREAPRLHATKTVYARFDAVGDLRIGAAVKLAGVPIGEVKEMAFDQGTVRLTLNIEPEAPVRQDSEAMFLISGLLGERYVDLSMGSTSAPLLPEEGEIAGKPYVDLSTVMVDLSEAAQGLGKLGDAFGEDQGAAFAKLHEILDENDDNIRTAFENLAKIGPDISEAARSINSIAQKIDNGEGILAKLVNDDELGNKLTEIADNLTVASEQMRNAFDGIDRLASRIDQGEGSLGKLMSRDDLYDNAEEAFRVLAEAAGRVSEVAKQFQGSEGTLGRLINDPELYEEAAKTLKQVGEAAQQFQEQGTVASFASVLLSGAR